MSYWALEIGEGVLTVFLQNEELLATSHQQGVVPAAVRNAFENALAQHVFFKLATTDGLTVLTEHQELSDLLVWSWVPIFSERGRGLAAELGCTTQEFVPCQFETNPGEMHYMHLPARSYDVVDLDQSTFLMKIPVDPPIPFHTQFLVMRAFSGPLPPLFRVPAPGGKQVLGDLFVSDEFKLSWEERGFTGAQFRKLDCPL